MTHEEDLLEPLEPALRCAFASTTHRSDSLASILARGGEVARDSQDEASPLGDGDTIADTYRVIGPIARGGVGHVFRARDLVFGRDVAIKLLRPRFADRPDMIRRFWQEAQIGAQLQHPGIVGVYDIGVTAQRRPYFAMKLVRGRTLAAVLADPAADHVARIRVFAQLCDTIGYAHARGVVHRDLKPANVMIGAHGEVQVMDWGLARVLHRVADGDASDAEAVECVDLAGASVHGGVLGTPGYMAPEQAHGEATTPRADVFSLGALLCELLVGQPAFSGADSEARLDATRRGDLAAVHAKLAASDAAPDLVDLARRCVALDPAARPADAQVVAHEVADHLASVERRLRAAEVEAARAAGEAAQERRARRLLTLWLGVCVTGWLGEAEEKRKSRCPLRSALT